ncbi:MAG: hypothetical protein ACK5MV_02805 [Aminipila sp.]
MTIKDLIEKELFYLANTGENTELAITKCFCCDLLSIAMGKAPSGCAWITVMANVNTLAVASLAEVACIILAEDTKLDENALAKAKEHGITVFYTELPVFDAALEVNKLIAETL